MFWSMREVLVANYPLERAGSGLVWKCGFQIGDFFFEGSVSPMPTERRFPAPTDRVSLL